MTAPRGPGAEAFVAWLRDFPRLVTTDPTPIRVDGFAGVTVDIEVAAGVIPGCGEQSHVDFMEAGGDVQAIRSGERRRLIVLTLDDRNLAVIAIEADDPAGLEAFAAQAQPIIESMHFR